MKPYFADEAMWAGQRRLWKCRVLWNRYKYPLVAGIVVVAYLLLTYWDERERRIGAEYNVQILTNYIQQGKCYTNRRPASLIIVGDSFEHLDEALKQVSREADNQRMVLHIAKVAIQ